MQNPLSTSTTPLLQPARQHASTRTSNGTSNGTSTSRFLHAARPCTASGTAGGGTPPYHTPARHRGTHSATPVLPHCTTLAASSTTPRSTHSTLPYRSIARYQSTHSTPAETPKQGTSAHQPGVATIQHTCMQYVCIHLHVYLSLSLSLSLSFSLSLYIYIPREVEKEGEGKRAALICFVPFRLYFEPRAAGAQCPHR